ncbi:hypothetical protein KP509_27G054600 [Ceratopteris richardii]|uniref:Uncharacterized protein n=1 Tax=Ceratopteris richardii TaxID=49495 RepID=A0A8T2RI96_CERRI|nr:hypothetical protein KP509_27G054600 [Ceratopteris richardii]KAH7295555.1 hypothetical protein KP509_27G054600 [Ceratopteris richardii]
MDAHPQQTDLVTGKTFTTSTSSGPYSQSQIIPYTQPRQEYGGSSTVQNKVISKSKSASWSMDDPEMKRRRRVASYKVYAVEGRVKYSLRKSVRWIKDKYLEMRYGWW